MAAPKKPLAARGDQPPDDQAAQYLFPRWFPVHVFLLTLALRVYYVAQPHNWWILHPDEIYQSLEVAHSEMYGYGFRPFEFMSPDRAPELSNIRHQELDHGMAALRSFLVPRAYVMVTWLLELLGISFTPFVAWKVAHAVVTSTLPLAVYRYVMAVFRSHDTACLASVLCAACAQLHVLGTHTLVNSLLAPPVFFVLSHVHTLMTSSSKYQVIDPLVRAATGTVDGTGGCMHKGVKGTEQVDVQKINIHSAQNGKNRSKNKAKGKQVHRNGIILKHRNGHVGYSHRKRCHTDVNGNVYVGNIDQSHSNVQPASSIMCNGKISNTDENRGHPETFVTNGTIHFDHVLSDKSQSASKLLLSSFRAHAIGHVSSMAAGVVLGMCCYIRTDVVVLIIASLLPHWSPSRTRYGNVISCMCGAVGGLCIGVVEDFRCYGWGVVTPLNWYKFNVENDYSAAIFGLNSYDVYLKGIFLQNYGVASLICFSIMCAAAASFLSRASKHSQQKSANTVSRVNFEYCNTWIGPSARLAVSWVCLLLLYSSKGHKELRFVHNVIVLVLITCAAALQGAVTLLHVTVTRRSALYLGVACFALSQWHDVVSLTDIPRGVRGNEFAFKKAGDTQDVNICLHYISAQHDVTGVFLDRNVYASAGYTILHKNVSLFAIMNDNFFEYAVEDRLSFMSHNLIGPRKNVSVVYLGHVSNYVSLRNAQFVMRFVLEDARYNYLVVLKERNFDSLGFGDPVFQYGAFKVLRRPGGPEARARDLQLAAMIKPIANATVLLHEADRLLWQGAWTRAADRFKAVLGLDSTTVAAYSPLAYCYKMLGDVQRFESTLTECYRRFGEEACERPRGLVQLK